MHLLLVTGFLGSGKTSFIIQLAREFTAADRKVAILVNEIGEIGIDDQVMRQLDLDVWEIMNGCICCTLSADLVATLQKLDAEYQVDFVIVEPSGAAEPGNILHALPYYKGAPLESVRSIAMLDPLRITELYAVLTPLVTKQIEGAQQVILTKADLASDKEIENARRIAEQINPSGKLYVLSVIQPLPAELLQDILT